MLKIISSDTGLGQGVFEIVLERAEYIFLCNDCNLVPDIV